MYLVSEKSKKIASKYFPTDLEWVITELQDYCVYLSGFFDEEAVPESYERFCFAILKTGKASKDRFSQSIELGKSDYRDLLVLAKFANSLTAHSEWANKVLCEKT